MSILFRDSNNTLFFHPFQIDGGWTYNGGETPLFGRYRFNLLGFRRGHDGIDAYEPNPSQRHDGKGPPIRTGGHEVLVHRGEHTGYGNTVITMSDHLALDRGALVIDTRRREGAASQFPDRHGYPEGHAGDHRTTGAAGSSQLIRGEVKSISAFTLYGHLGNYGDVSNTKRYGLLEPDTSIGNMGRSGIQDSRIGDHLHVEYLLRVDMRDGTKHILAVDPQAMLGQYLNGEPLDLTDAGTLNKLLANAQSTNMSSYLRNFDVAKADALIDPQRPPPMWMAPESMPIGPLISENQAPIIPQTLEPPRLAEAFTPPALGEPPIISQLPEFDTTVPPSPFEQDPQKALIAAIDGTDPHAENNLKAYAGILAEEGLYPANQIDTPNHDLLRLGVELQMDETGRVADRVITEFLDNDDPSKFDVAEFQAATNAKNIMDGLPPIDVDGFTGGQTNRAETRFAFAADPETAIENALEDGNTRALTSYKTILADAGLYTTSVADPNNTLLTDAATLYADATGTFAQERIADYLRNPDPTALETAQFQAAVNAQTAFTGGDKINVDGLKGNQVRTAALEHANANPTLKIADTLQAEIEERFPGQLQLETPETNDDVQIADVGVDEQPAAPLRLEITPPQITALNDLRQLAQNDDRDGITAKQNEWSEKGYYVDLSHRYAGDGHVGKLASQEELETGQTSESMTEHAARLADDLDGSYAQMTIAGVLESGILDERNTILLQTSLNKLNALNGTQLMTVDGKVGTQTYGGALDYAAQNYHINVSPNIAAAIEDRFPGGLHERRLAALANPDVTDPNDVYNQQASYARIHVAKTLVLENPTRDDVRDMQKSLKVLGADIEVDGGFGRNTAGATVDYLQDIQGIEVSDRFTTLLQRHAGDRYAEVQNNGTAATATESFDNASAITTDANANTAFASAVLPSEADTARPNRQITPTQQPS